MSSFQDAIATGPPSRGLAHAAGRPLRLPTAGRCRGQRHPSCGWCTRRASFRVIHWANAVRSVEEGSGLAQGGVPARIRRMHPTRARAYLSIRPDSSQHRSGSAEPSRAPRLGPSSPDACQPVNALAADRDGSIADSALGRCRLAVHRQVHCHCLGRAGDVRHRVLRAPDACAAPPQRSRG